MVIVVFASVGCTELTSCSIQSRLLTSDIIITPNMDEASNNSISEPLDLVRLCLGEYVTVAQESKANYLH